MKHLIIAICIALSSCGGESNEETLAEIEVCLDSGGEWQGECVYSGEYCIERAQCKPGATFCPCVIWGVKE